MKSLDDFKRFYDSELQTSIAEVKELTAKARKQVLIRRLLLIIPILCIPALLLLAEKYTKVIGDSSFYIFLMVLAWIAVVGAIYYLIRVTKRIKSEYALSFKELLITKIVNFVDGNLKYSPMHSMNQQEFERSGLFRQMIDKYWGDDFVSGTIGVTKISFSEIHAVRVVRSDDNKEKDESIFNGLFFKCDFNKDFQGKTFVLPDKSEKFLGRFAQKLQSISKQYGNLIILEDPEFEKLFKVYSTDQIEARYILSTSLMKRIVEFKQKTEGDIFISFVQSSMYIAISSKKEFFEPRLWRDSTSFDKLSEYLEDLILVVGIVEDLNLNTRIWSKQ